MYDNVTFRRLKIIFRATCCFPFKKIFCVPVNTAKNVILIVPLIHLTNREINLSYKRNECHMISLRENGRSFCTSNIWHNHSHNNSFKLWNKKVEVLEHYLLNFFYLYHFSCFIMVIKCFIVNDDRWIIINN